MPYEWTKPTPPDQTVTLSLWPYRSLLRRDFVIFFGATVLVIALPLIVLLGSPVLWVLLSFFAVVLWGLWAAIGVSYKRGEVLETLTIDAETIALTHHDPKSGPKEWSTNVYWARVCVYKDEGPVEYYLTLRGGDREVEIGAFLDVGERHALYDDLVRIIGRA